MNSSFKELGSLPLFGSIGAAVIGIVLILVARQSSGDAGTKQFLFSWLVNFAFFLSIAVGALFFVLFQHITRAGWGVVIRRFAEFLAMGMIPIFILSLPIIFSSSVVGIIYMSGITLKNWHTAEYLVKKLVTSTNTFSLVAGYFTSSSGFLWRSSFSIRSILQDQTKDKSLTLLFERSAPALAIMALQVMHSQLSTGSCLSTINGSRRYSEFTSLLKYGCLFALSIICSFRCKRKAY
ncbi:MAG: hypothetical protein R3C11_05235 [Planctomycetaceae bacterium]